MCMTLDRVLYRPAEDHWGRAKRGSGPEMEERGRAQNDDTRAGDKVCADRDSGSPVSVPRKCGKSLLSKILSTTGNNTAEDTGAPP